jgi:hypothetical protein
MEVVVEADDMIVSDSECSIGRIFTAPWYDIVRENYKDVEGDWTLHLGDPLIDQRPGKAIFH